VDITEAVKGSRDLDDAAQLWAEATAARDRSADVADLNSSRPVLEAVLDRSPHSFVLIARADDGSAAGLAAVEPAGATAAEVCYFGVHPGHWGQGVGAVLLRAVQERLTASGYRTAQLLVYTDNTRAVALYERLGWQPAGRPAPHPRTGKPEQRYVLALAAAKEQ
jgi:ribosomal protein S18 acetylase RimI-like enzyme